MIDRVEGFKILALGNTFEVGLGDSPCSWLDIPESNGLYSALVHWKDRKKELVSEVLIVFAMLELASHAFVVSVIQA
jgi:hypothetical protein